MFSDVNGDRIRREESAGSRERVANLCFMTDLANDETDGAVHYACEKGAACHPPLPLLPMIIPAALVTLSTF